MSRVDLIAAFFTVVGVGLGIAFSNSIPRLMRWWQRRFIDRRAELEKRL